jgi:hypothetical protein
MEKLNQSVVRRVTGGRLQKLVAFPTTREQVGLYVVTKGTAPYQMVNIEILGGSTLLTAPTISLQDFSTQLRI